MKKLLEKKQLLIVLSIVIGIFFLDYFTKLIVMKNMYYGDSIPVIKDFFNFTYIKNTGAAFGMFSGNIFVLSLISLTAVGIFSYFAKDVNFKTKKIYSISLCLIISGALGNMYDRMVYKFVVDFFDFIIFGFNFAVFNVADIALVVGVIMLSYDILFLENKRKSNE